MNNLQQDETPVQYALRLLDDGKTREQIEKSLIEMGHNVLFAKEIIAETYKLRNAQRSSKGLTFILVGAIVCFLSFLLTITGVFPDHNINLVLYGLTSVGVILVFVGLTYVF
jgi:hypothetical protein